MAPVPAQAVKDEISRRLKYVHMFTVALTGCVVAFLIAATWMLTDELQGAEPNERSYLPFARVSGYIFAFLFTVVAVSLVYYTIKLLKTLKKLQSNIPPEE